MASYGKSLYGKLNREQVVPDYQGATTESVNVTVDNESRVIRADVNWDAAIGEIYGKAYPGDKGARNYEEIQQLKKALNDELSSSKSFRTNATRLFSGIQDNVDDVKTLLDKRVEEESQRAIKQEQDIFHALVTECERSIQVENDLIQQLKQEIQSRSDVDKDIEAKIEVLSDISTANIETLQAFVDTEMQRATTAELQLEELVDTEMQRAKEAESNLQLYTDKCVQELHTELEDITSNISEHVGNSQAILISAVEQSLTNSINNETTRASSAEAMISENIESVAYQVNKLDITVEDITDAVETLSTDVEQLQSIQRSTDGHITTLTSDIDELSESLQTVEQALLEEQNRATEEENELHDLIIDQSARLGDIESSLSTLSDEFRALPDINQLNESLLETEKDINKLDINTSKISSYVATLEDNIKAEYERAKSAEDSLVAAQTKQGYTITDISDKLKKLTENVETHETSITSIDDTLSTLTSNVNNLLESDTTSHEGIDELRTILEEEIQRSTVQDDSLTQVTSTNTHNIELLQDGVKVLDSTLAEYKREATKSLNDVKNFSQSSIDSLQKQTTSINATTGKLEKSLNEEILARTLADAELQDTLNESIKRISNNEESICLTNDQLHAMQHLLSTVEKTADEVKTQCENQSSSIARVANSLDSVKVAIHLNSSKIGNPENTVETIDKLVQSNSLKISTLENSVVKLEERAAAEVTQEELQSEISERQAEDNHTRTVTNLLISEEATARKAAIDQLSSDINNEVAIRMQDVVDLKEVDQQLADDLEQHNSRLADLESKNIEQDDDLSALKTDISLLENNLNAEIEEHDKRHHDDLIIQSALLRDEFNKADVAIVEYTKETYVPIVATEDDNTCYAYIQEGTATTTKQVTVEPIEDTIVKRDTNGNILLSNQVDSIPDDAAVSKSYVEQSLDSRLSYKFIDCGNSAEF